ncbi:Lrp/AsnC ligand binding domain-containing protein [Halosquirtibacter laminarini]|uniref:Lrp/AsnC ligand binding domain-containing protein n=1 Tax=Halosquirtibacter laminarini TaxID=3374600 RepID=A0AC61NQV8_9BACT|nr:Lrp/AsnC ligand binding domain-containing protein [Prolixibacteraceae bacterium]
MSNKGKLDDIDLKILDIISQNARIPFKDVAEKCGISRAAVHQRVNRLIEMKVIVGSGYHIDPKKVDYSTCTYVGIFLDQGGLYPTVAEKLKEIPEIVECHYTTGQYAIFAKVYSRDNEHLKDILIHQIQPIKGITSTETIISLEETFRREVPIILNHN